MTKEEQLRYLEQIYGDIEDGNCDLSEAILHQDISGSKVISLSVMYGRSSQVNLAAGHNHNHGHSTLYRNAGVYVSSDPAVYTSITGVTS